MSELIQNPVVTVDDVQYELQIVCGSDYKVRIAEYKTSYSYITVSSPHDGPKQCHVHILLPVVHG